LGDQAESPNGIPRDAEFETYGPKKLESKGRKTVGGGVLGGQETVNLTRWGQNFMEQINGAGKGCVRGRMLKKGNCSQDRRKGNGVERPNKKKTALVSQPSRGPIAEEIKWGKKKGAKNTAENVGGKQGAGAFL